MAHRAISVRLDDKALRALDRLEATGYDPLRSDPSSPRRGRIPARRQTALAAEVAALEADDDDRAEMLAVAPIMESLRAPR